jgi:glycerol-3-phosphate dehydrogenase
MGGPAFDRAEALRRLGTEHFDVLVIGGGITGAGVALDAASRGLSVALVERDDFASGTSSKSSKLVHGGLRYLQHREFKLVYENLYERQIALRNAPHLVRILPFLIPVLSKDGLMNAKLARALGTGGSRRTLRSHTCRRCAPRTSPRPTSTTTRRPTMPASP